MVLGDLIFRSFWGVWVRAAACFEVGFLKTFYVRVIIGLYLGYIGIMEKIEKNIETTVFLVICHPVTPVCARAVQQCKVFKSEFAVAPVSYKPFRGLLPWGAIKIFYPLCRPRSATATRKP